MKLGESEEEPWLSCVEGEDGQLLWESCCRVYFFQIEWEMEVAWHG
jgi:hypothetical protein